MDSVTQAVLGAAVGVAVMGRRTALWKSALVGAICGTLPDLDFLIDYGDPISNMVSHRGFSHSLPYLTLLAPFLTWLVASVLDSTLRFRRWWLAIWLVLVTHVLLDAMTVYGTQLALPFSNYPFALNSIFIIDPLYTLPLLLGLLLTLRGGASFWNSAGLLLSGCYLLWSFGAQQYVQTLADRSLEEQGWQVERRMVTPAPFNTVLWRVIAITSEGVLEGFYSFNDSDTDIQFEPFSQGRELYRQLEEDPGVDRIARFSKGFFKLEERNGRVLISDLRMGQEPRYSFNFLVAQRRDGKLEPVAPRLIMERPELRPALDWLWRRIKGEQVEPPRSRAGQ